MSTKNLNFHCDYIVVGSGFGGSVAALRLAEKGYSVLVIEQGRRFNSQNLPKTTWDFKNWLWEPLLGWRGFFALRFFRHAVVLHGNAVGGGSITYANTLLVPPEKVWQQGEWAGLYDWQKAMPDHFATAKKMLGVTTNKIFGPADYKLKEMSKLIGAEKSFYPTEVGVFFGHENEAPGKEYADPYFAGRGPSRKSCIACGGCMVGCRHGAKNTLDLNYLYLAEKLGAEILPETKVVDIKPLSSEGADGYGVVTNTGKVFKTRAVVIAGSSLGTQELLFKLKDCGSLPQLSAQLGKTVRTNAESLIGVRFPHTTEDLSQGIAIGSGIYIDEHTHIEAVRYPAGSNAMALLTTVLTHGRADWTRILTWLFTLLRELIKNPIKILRALSPKDWAKECVIFLCMQTVDSTLTMKWKRPWYWPFRKKLVSFGKAIPTFIPAANSFAAKSAQALGGVAATSITEIFLNVPMTAHCLGGVPMGTGPQNGVVDFKGQVFNYQNLIVCDGSIISSNLGVNPSLTITALAEHVMGFIPVKKHASLCE